MPRKGKRGKFVVAANGKQIFNGNREIEINRKVEKKKFVSSKSLKVFDHRN